MYGFFSLGGAFGSINKEHHDQNLDQHSVVTPKSLLKNETIDNKGFELWQPYYQHRQLSPQYEHLGDTDGDSCTSRQRTGKSNTNRFSNNNQYESWWKVMRQGGYGIGGGDYVGVGGGTNCQDCGNQAKKDCQYMRCRTCCKSRGFQCQTHVKSTWVPAAKRRERQQQLAVLTQHSSGKQELSLMMRDGGSDQHLKRLREDQHVIATAGGGVTVAVNLPATHHQSISSSGLEIGHFPAELSSPAVFRCVRVSAMGETEEQLAYQTSVSIGGHVFKGILYDRGPEGPYNHPSCGGDSSSTAGDRASTQHQQLNLITSGTMGVTTATVNPNATNIDPSNIFPTPLNAFMVGAQYFPPPSS